MNKPFDPSAIPAGMEMRNLALSFIVLICCSFWFADFLDGTMQMRGGTELTFNDSPIAFSFVAVLAAALELYALGYALSAIVALLRSKRNDGPGAPRSEKSE